MGQLGAHVRKGVTRLLLTEDAGATAVEYALMIILIAFVIIGAVTVLGTTLSSMFQAAATSL